MKNATAIKAWLGEISADVVYRMLFATNGTVPPEMNPIAKKMRMSVGSARDETSRERLAPVHRRGWRCPWQRGW